MTNFANGDVIGHTASDDAKRKAVVAVDKYLGETLKTAREQGYTVFVTADHGNIETLRTGDGKPHGAHTTNLVAISAVGEGIRRLTNRGKLCDVLDAPTAENPLATEPMPVWNALVSENPTAQLDASGPAVGLAEGKTGNSEAGHINLGSGRVVLQDDVRLDNAMKDGSFYENPVFLKTIRDVKARGGALHVLGLLTKKSSHGSVDYPLAVLKMAEAEGLKDVYVHVIFDGRSTQPGSAPSLLREFGRQVGEIGSGVIVSGVGRGVALDRDQNWAKVERAYRSLTEGKGEVYEG